MGSLYIPAPGGGQYAVNVSQREFPPNLYNGCIGAEIRLWEKINRCGGLQAICPGHGTRYDAPPWQKMPMQGKRFGHPSSIPLPNADGLDHVVQSFLVPTGYDGVIAAPVNIYTGMGFAEGSGDLTWRIRINLRYAKDYGAITTSLGSLTTPYYNANSQIIIQSGDLVQYIVNRSVPSLGNLNGGRIICALFGWFWPR